MEFYAAEIQKLSVVNQRYRGNRTIRPGCITGGIEGSALRRGQSSTAASSFALKRSAPVEPILMMCAAISSGERNPPSPKKNGAGIGAERNVAQNGKKF